MDVIWKKVKAVLKPKLPEHSFRMWIDPLQVKKVDKRRLVLTCPNQLIRKRVLDQFEGAISKALEQVLQVSCKFDIEVDIYTRVKKSAAAVVDRQLTLPGAGFSNYGKRLLRQDYTFDQFVVGGNNDFAYSASLSLANGKDSRRNALFLISNTGLGKSHLSQAIGNHILSRSPRERLYYTTAEDFSNEMVNALRSGAIDRFKEKYCCKCDTLLLEDVHHLSGKSRTQVELAMTLDSLNKSQKKVILSSCFRPADIPRLDEKLRSCMTSGIVSSIEPPNFRTRVRILRKKAEALKVKLPDEVLSYLAGELTDDVRQLESGLIGVTAKSSLMGATIDLSLAESVVRTIAKHRKSITVDAIKQMICKHYNVSSKELMSPSRRQAIVHPRQVAIYLSRQYTDTPIQTIGKSFNRYHATALHAINCIEKKMDTDQGVAKQIEMLSGRLEAGKF